MRDNPLTRLSALGQSVWLDYIRRGLITSGELKRMIEEDGLRGMTSNPTIFEKAIGGTHEYDTDIEALARQGKNVNEIYESLSQQDIRAAADQFRSVYDQTDGRDGYVSLEVNPHLAHDTEGTIAEARRLWTAVHRPNIFIKVPGTKEGLPAIRQLISEGMNVNVTLLFGLPRYKEVTEAFISGLKARATQKQPLDRVASVASFFLSRIDVLIDPQLERLIKQGGEIGELAKQVHGQVAIASAKIAYQMYTEIFSSASFGALEQRGARPQRLLWASTGTKNPEYSDVKYIEPLIAPETINTVPVETFNAYKDHGNPRLTLHEGLDKAYTILEQLLKAGIDINQVTQQLEDEGVNKFNAPFDKLLQTLKTAVERYGKK